MALKLRIKPEGKIFVNGNGWIKNAGNRPIDVIVSLDLKTERPEHLQKMLQKKASEDGVTT